MDLTSIFRHLVPLCACAGLLPALVYAQPAGEFDCLIEPHMVVELSSRVDGIIERVLIERGDVVEPDQVIAELESGAERAALEYARARSEMSAEIHEQEAQLQYGSRNEDRLTELHRKQAVSASEIDRARTEAAVARFRLAQARENKRLAELELARATETLNRHIIRSPIRGVVVERYLNPGESVEDKAIVKLAQIDPLRVEVVVPVAQFGRIQRGQKAAVYPEPVIGGEYESTVSNVDPVLDAASGTFRVRLDLPNPGHRLTSGLKCRVQFDDPPLAEAGDHSPSATGGPRPEPGSSS